MPKTKISEYSTTNADNTDIESINIAENCPPSGINNAIRELMVHLKEFQTGASGDGFTFAGGTLMTGTNTLSGTNVLSGSTTAAFAAGTVSAPSIYASGDTNTGIFFPAADTIAFSEGGAEAMRIDSSGNLLVGATALASSEKLLVSNSVNSTSSDTLIVSNPNTSSSGVTSGIGFFAGGADSSRQRAAIRAADDGAGVGRLMFYTREPIGGSIVERMRINSSGNVGIGTSSPGTKLEVSHSSLSYTDGLILTNSLNFGYGNSITFRAVLTDGGSVGNAARIQQSYESSNNYNLIFSTTGSGTLTERARITSGGYFKASNNSSYWSVSTGYHEFNQSANRSTLISYNSNTGFSGEAPFVGIAKRSASSAYSLTYLYSGEAADLEFDLRGDGNGYADGTWNNNGADYAEFFESANGQALTLGATVVLDGTKVREATAQDDPKNIIGVVRPKEPSKASMVVGNTAWNKWANKYLTDDFDRYIMEDHDVVEWEEQVLEKEAVAAVEAVLDEEGNEVSAAIPAQEAVYKTVKHSYESHNIPAGITVPADAVRKTHDDKGNKFQHYKLNPAWDKDAEYTPREKRPEWNIIGLLGQVKILKGQPVSDRWIKMRDVSATVEEWMIR